MKTIPFWTDQTPRPANIPLSELPSEVDVAIVGSGYTGLHAARALLKSGARVAVLEQNSIGWGASSRNGGMLTPGLKASMETVLRRYGEKAAAELWQWSLDSVDYVDATVREENIDCDFSRPGHFYLAHKPSHFEHIKRHKDFLAKQFGYTAPRVVPPSEIRAEIGSSAFHGGLADDFSAALNPAKYVFGLARAVGEQGACLVEQAAVTRIRRANGKFALATAKGELRANEVLLATNGYTTGLVRRARHGVFPVGSYIIVTEPLPLDLQKELSPKGRMFYDSKYFLNYFRLTADGRMLFGGRNNLSTNLDLEDSARRLQRRMIEVFPQLAGVPLTHTWTGKLGITFDLMPHIGRINGIHYAYGYNGHGISIASNLGREVGELIAGQRSSSRFMEIYHPRFFFAAYETLYLPFVAQWYRFLDRYT